MSHRAAWLTTLLLAGALLGPAAPAADAPPPPAAPVPADPQAAAQKAKVQAAVDRALTYLRTHQRGDGAIVDNQTPMATTSLAIMAIMSAGHLPDDPTPEGEAIRKALAFILLPKHQDPVTGYMGASDGSRMYGHGITALMLAEVLGMGIDEQQDRLIRQHLYKAVDLILWAQTQKKPDNVGQYGGWRYEPNSGDSDLSVTVWQVMALRAAKNAGMEVPKKAVEDAVRYLKGTYHSARAADGSPKDLKSGFAYQTGGGPTYSTAAEGLLALQVCGAYEIPEVKGAADYLLGFTLDPNTSFFFYGTYYYSQGMYQRGGKHAEAARKNVEECLLAKQNPDGSWVAKNGGEGGLGPVYATAMAVLSLSIEYHYLPIYQR